MKKSWRTTTLGVIAIGSAVFAGASALLDGNPNTNLDWPTTMAAISAGWGLIFARDNSVTSEEAGAK